MRSWVECHGFRAKIKIWNHARAACSLPLLFGSSEILRFVVYLLLVSRRTVLVFGCPATDYPMYNSEATKSIELTRPKRITLKAIDHRVSWCQQKIRVWISFVLNSFALWKEVQDCFSFLCTTFRHNSIEIDGFLAGIIKNIAEKEHPALLRCRGPPIILNFKIQNDWRKCHGCKTSTKFWSAA